ncbi:MAG: hypothetical protein ACPLPR_01345 [Bacillota bacterium]
MKRYRVSFKLDGAIEQKFDEVRDKAAFVRAAVEQYFGTRALLRGIEERLALLERIEQRLAALEERLGTAAAAQVRASPELDKEVEAKLDALLDRMLGE